MFSFLILDISRACPHNEMFILSPLFLSRYKPDGTMTFTDAITEAFLTTDEVITNQTSPWLISNSTELSATTTFASLVPTPASLGLGISEAAIRKFSEVTKGYVNPLLSLIGFLGNILGIGVLWRQSKQQKLSIFLYLGALTLFDIIFLLSGIINSTHIFVRPYNPDLSKYLVASMRLGLAYVDNILLHSSRMMVLVMSCERLMSVVRPLHVKNTWLVKYPAKITLAILLFNMTFSLPLVINGKVVTFTVNNATEYVFTFRNYDNFMSQYWVVEATVHSFIPMVFMIGINIAIPIAFYKSSVKHRSTLNTSSNNTVNQQRKITATVMAITILNIFLSLPIIGLKLLQFIEPNFNMHGSHRLVFWLIADITKLLAYVNAGNDFIIFFIVSNNYRQLFRAMYCSCCPGKKRQYREDKLHNP